MIWANRNGDRVQASPEIKDAICTCCNELLIPKCGDIKVWHFAHKANTDCDSWSEPESEWHINWKNEFPKEQQEVVITGDSDSYIEKHRADIKLPSGKVIELQNSSISSIDIEARERFYGDMIWLLNGETFAKNLQLRAKSNYFTFRWKTPPKSWWIAKKSIYIDLTPLANLYRVKIENLRWKIKKDNIESWMVEILNRDIFNWQSLIDIYENSLFLIQKIYPKCPCGGYGWIIPKDIFLNQVKNGNTN